ncbi:type VI secretion system effector DNase TafE [Acinetobacter oleivorans]|uniref:type VI secretion system effector DNase TafE n=1 Tax=Acinetobacter oleivorans TaxID=1148157 RepID=UPI001CD6E06C|nr:type VI secretion system effector DNase TafE [Acinetobacter oleivorans]
MPDPQNQQFWSKIAERPTEIQQQFWYGAEKLAKYLNDNPAMYKGYMTYDTSKPDPNLSWWEKILFYNGQAHYNEAVSNYNTGKLIADQGSWLWGMLKGDFNKDPSMSQIIVGGLISLIPVADQVCDIRDLIANFITLSDEKARTKDNYMALALTSVGIIPEVGSAIKTLVKSSRAKDVTKVKLFKFMEYFEEALTKLKIKCPWGKAPEAWLRSRPWKGIAAQGFTALKNNIDRILFVINKCLKKFNGALKVALAKFQATLNHVLSTIKKYIDQLCDEVDKAIGHLLPQQPLAMAHAGGGGKNTPTGRYEANVSSGKKTETSHRQKKETPPPPRKMKPKHVVEPCLEPKKGLKNSWGKKTGKSQAELDTEFDRQLKRQEEGLNRLTVEEYQQNRQLYEKYKRAGTGTQQQRIREDMQRQLEESEYKKLKTEQPQLSKGQIERMAENNAKKTLEGLDVLHNPDMQLGGFDVKYDPKKPPTLDDFGHSGVNRSIGSQMAARKRLANMDAAAAQAKAKGMGKDAMDVELKRCK